MAEQERVPQAWVDAAMDAAAGSRLKCGEEFTGEELDFDAAVAAVVPLVRKKTLAEVEEALRGKEAINAAWENRRGPHGAGSSFEEKYLAQVTAALATLHDQESQEDEGEEWDPPCTCDNSRYPDGQGGCELHNPLPLARPSGEEGEGEGAGWPESITLRRYTDLPEEYWAAADGTHDVAGQEAQVYALAAHPHDQEAPQDLREVVERGLKEAADEAAKEPMPGETARLHERCECHNWYYDAPCECNQEAPQVSSEPSLSEGPIDFVGRESAPQVSSAVAEAERRLASGSPFPGDREFLAKRKAVRPQVSSGDGELRDRAELLLTALLEILPVEGSWTSGYRVSEHFDSTLHALPEQWATAAQHLCEVHELIRRKPAPSTLTDEEQERVLEIALFMDHAPRKLVPGHADFLRTLAGKERP